MRPRFKLVLVLLTIFNGLILVTSKQTSQSNLLNIKSTEFSVRTDNVTFISTTYYHAKGMAPLYSVTNKFLDVVVGEDLIPDGYIVVEDFNNIKLGPNAKEKDWGDLLKTYWAILVIVLISALIIVLMPIIGLCFCCCRCAGSCGGRTQPFDKKHDGCRRAFWGLLLVISTSALIFGVVATFVTNTYMEDGVNNATTYAKAGVHDAQLYLNKTAFEFDHLLTYNFDQMSFTLGDILSNTSDLLIEKFENESKAISFIELSNFVQALPNVTNDLETMQSLTKDLRVKASQLNDGLRGVKRELLITLTKCALPKCKSILNDYEIGKLDINGIDYNQLPDDMLQQVLENVKQLLSITDGFEEGSDAIEKMQKEIKDAIDKNIPIVNKSVNDAGNELKSKSNKLTKSITDASNQLGDTSNKQLNTADKYIKDYAHYRYWFGLAISSILLLIVVCLVFGLLCGICGRRPSGYGDDCCNKGAGSNFLMCGVALIFLTISALTIVCLVYFLIGFVMHRGVCEPLKDPSNDKLFTNYIDKLIDLNKLLENDAVTRNLKKTKPNQMKPIKKTKPPFRISQVINACHQNESLYQVLKLESILDLNDLPKYLDKFNINDTIEDMLNDLKIDDVKIMTDGLRNALDKLENSKLSEFTSSKFDQYLEKNITSLNLTEIAQKLIETVDNINDKSKDIETTKTSLRTQALHLQTYQEKLVQPMLDNTDLILNISRSLETKLKFNHNSFSEAIKIMRQEIESADEFISKNGTDTLVSISRVLLESFTKEIDDYLNLIVNTVNDDVGSCYPLSNVYNAMLIGTCNSIVDPMNGFWAGLAWCIGLFILTIIFCAKLSTLYQKSDPYPGPIVEAEYLYDAYSERDNIPLATGPKHKRRKKYERRRNSREHRDYYEDSTSSHGPINGGLPREARYNDMAPKHWEGGPPRYQSPPIAPPDPEYERPPPYYYPGAAPAQE